MDNIKHTEIVDIFNLRGLGVQAVVEHGFWLFYERQGRNRPSPMRREAQIKWVRTRLLEQEIITHHLPCSDVRTVPGETQFSFRETP